MERVSRKSVLGDAGGVLAIMVFVGDYYLLKYAKIWGRFY